MVRKSVPASSRWTAKSMTEQVWRDGPVGARAPGGDAAGKLDCAARDRRLGALAGNRASAAAVGPYHQARRTASSFGESIT